MTSKNSKVSFREMLFQNLLDRVKSFNERIRFKVNPNILINYLLFMNFFFISCLALLLEPTFSLVQYMVYKNKKASQTYDPIFCNF